MKLALDFRKKIIVWISLSIVLVVLLNLLVIFPSQAALHDIKLSITAAEEQIQTEEANLQTAIVVQKNAGEINQTLGKVQSAYITADNPIDFISRLENLADQHHVKFDFSFSDNQTATTTPPTSSTPTDINMNFQGTLVDCFSFINAILHDTAYIDIIHLHITPADTSAPDQVSVSIQALTYWR